MIFKKSIPAAFCLVVVISTQLPGLGDPVHFKYGPPFTHMRTSYDGLLTAPEAINKQPEQRTMEQEQAPQAEYAKKRLQILPDTKFDPRSNAESLDKEELELEEVSPANWQFISHLPKLKKAFVCYTEPGAFKQGLFEALNTCSALSILGIHGDPSLVDLSCLRNHPSLTNIGFSEPDVPAKSIKEIAKISKVERLTLSNPKFTQEAIDAIGEMKSLKFLSLVGEILKDCQIANYSPLTKLENLEYLYLVAPIRDSEADELSQLKHVRFLTLGNDQNKNLVYKIAKIPTLVRALHLENQGKPPGYRCAQGKQYQISGAAR